jgi:CheY-like chemotaxis protein
MRASPLIGKRLLLIANDPEVIEAIVYDLADPIVGEVPVVDVAEGDRAAELIRPDAFDLVFIDAAYAEGWSQLVRAVATGVPVIVVATAAVLPADLAAARQGGAIAYIPLDREHGIEQIVVEVLTARAAGRDPWALVLSKLGVAG